MERIPVPKTSARLTRNSSEDGFEKTRTQTVHAANGHKFKTTHYRSTAPTPMHHLVPTRLRLPHHQLHPRVSAQKFRDPQGGSTNISTL